MTDDYSSEYFETTGGCDTCVGGSYYGYGEDGGLGAHFAANKKCYLVGLLVTVVVTLIVIPLALNAKGKNGWYGLGEFNAVDKVKSLVGDSAGAAAAAADAATGDAADTGATTSGMRGRRERNESSPDWADYKKEPLEIVINDPMRGKKERMLSNNNSGTGAGRSAADIQNVYETYSDLNNVAPDAAVQQVYGNYSDFGKAMDVAYAPRGKGRKGMNSADSGGNRFAGSQTNTNQEGSLWQKPVEEGSFLERFGGRRSRMTAGSGNGASKWGSGSKWSEAALDPNRMYAESNTVGQPLYEWGYTSARGPRGKTDMLLEAAAQGL